MRRDDPVERPTSHADLVRWYSRALAAQERSGLSVTEYARRLGVAAATLYHWRRRLCGGGELRSATETGRPGLVEVVVDGQAGEAGKCTVVHLGGSRSIEVPRGFDGDDLRRLVKLLESC